MVKYPLFLGKLLAAAVILLPGVTASAHPIQDAESTTHGYEAAWQQVKDTYQYPGFKIVQHELGTLSHYSYLLISGKEALLIDPGRDVFAYLETAQKEGVKITGVWLSHSHADFIAGHLEAADRLKVPIYISEKAKAGYEHKPLTESDSLSIGDAVLKFIETPGHTLDSMCAVVASKQAPDKPLVVFTGDTLFIGSVGRPDLLGDAISAAALASMLYDTWTNKLSKLPDEVMIFPAHGAGSLCGAHLSDEPTSTLGQQRVSNSYLTHKNRSEFVAAVLEGLPEAPQYFKHNAALNRKGPELVEWEIESLPTIEPSEELTDPAKYYVVDLRDAKQYAAGHLPNSVAIGLRGRLETWVGIMVPWDANLVLTGNEKELREALYRLHRVGYKAKVIDIDTWKKANLPLATNDNISPQKLYEQIHSSQSPLVVDVRLPSEWMGLRIGTVINIPLSKLADDADKLDRQQRVVTVCNSAYRSTMAVGVLERQGFKNVASLDGGSEAWIEAGLPVYEAKKEGVPSTQPKRQVKLAERISAAELKRLLMDLPGTFQLIDLRPAEQYADYSLPGSENVEIAAVLDNPAYLSGAGPLVIVDRDGTLAMMVAGILSQKTDRPIKALYGGLAAYWSEADLGAAAAPRDAMHAPPPGQKAPAAARQPSQSAPKVAPQSSEPVVKPKKRSAGC